MKLPPRLPAYKLVALAIKEFIESNGLKKGDALPAEAAFAQQLGISRPSLREGVKALESVGVLESRHGEGVFVADFSFDPIVDNLPYSLLADDAQLLHLLEVRTALEVGMIPKIVQIVPAQDLIKLRQLASRMHELALRDISFEDEDREFHATLFWCLNNPFLNRLVDLFWQVFTACRTRYPGQIQARDARLHSSTLPLSKNWSVETLLAFSRPTNGISKRFTNAS